jgi:orotidine-5'-phosphate decarboxylase
MNMMIEQEKSLIPACDVDLDRFELIVKETAHIPIISAYKIGFMLAMEAGLPKVCEAARRHTAKPLIYDHQKAATDIPDTGKAFMHVCKKAGIDAVILFPQAGPETERAWIEAAKAEGLGAIVGGLMTHKCYTRGDGGYIADEAVIEIYLNAVKQGVTDFVVPGTNPEAIRKIREMLEHQKIEPVLYSPGLVTQGGDMKKALSAAGKRWHAIVGRAIYSAKNIHKAVEEISESLRA